MKKFFHILFACASFAMSSDVHAYDSLLILGDSYSDTGQSFIISQRTVPPTPPYFYGHWSNGQMWPEFIGSLIGLNQLPLNYAVGGATSGHANTVNPILGGLQDQVARFRYDFCLKSNTLSVIEIGTNDYLSYLFEPAALLDPESREQVIRGVVNNIIAAVKRLDPKDKHQIVVFNLPDLGRLPVFSLGVVDVLKDLYSQVAREHNAQLQQAIRRLNSGKKCKRPVVIYDFFSSLNTILNNFESEGVSTTFISYIIQSLDPFVIVPFPFPPTPPTFYAFFDQFHFGTETHERLAESIATFLNKLE